MSTATEASTETVEAAEQAVREAEHALREARQRRNGVAAKIEAHEAEIDALDESIAAAHAAGEDVTQLRAKRRELRLALEDLRPELPALDQLVKRREVERNAAKAEHAEAERAVYRREAKALADEVFDLLEQVNERVERLEVLEAEDNRAASRWEQAGGTGTKPPRVIWASGVTGAFWDILQELPRETRTALRGHPHRQES